jgi:hypothetical protein
MLSFIIWWVSIGGGLVFLYTFIYHRGLRSMVDHQVMFCPPDQAEVWKTHRSFFFDVGFFLSFLLLNALLIYPAALKMLRDSAHYMMKDMEGGGRGNKKD